MSITAGSAVDVSRAVTGCGQVNWLAVLDGQLGWTQGRGRLCRTDC